MNSGNNSDRKEMREDSEQSVQPAAKIYGLTFYGRRPCEREVRKCLVLVETGCDSPSNQIHEGLQVRNIF